ncbi:hypothetical protein GCM10009530_03030 [Microbispora corallina]|uniref:HNH nuclease domain-containing protein n=1 Tax=Microbispora corallina TaxID=83302 RepID=A0ABQ4FRM5_9ACTN|nr:hypothetical protein Mco01_04700 [Microbispora corallina]
MFEVGEFVVGEEVSQVSAFPAEESFGAFDDAHAFDVPSPLSGTILDPQALRRPGRRGSGPGGRRRRDRGRRQETFAFPRGESAEGGARYASGMGTEEADGRADAAGYASGVGTEEADGRADAAGSAGSAPDTAAGPAPEAGTTATGEWVSRLRETASRLAAADPPDSAVTCLEEAEELTTVRDLVISAITARVDRVHATGEAKANGHASTGTWLRTATGMTGAGATRLLRISTELSRLPVVRDRFASGALAEGAVDAITQVTARLTEAQAALAEPILLELAQTASPAEVCKVGRYLRELLDPGSLDGEAEDDYAARFLLVRPSPTGGVEGEFRLPREAGARLREFLTAYARPRDKHDDRPLRVRQADAFSALLTKKVSTELLVLVRAESLPDDALSGSDQDQAAAREPVQEQAEHEPGHARAGASGGQVTGTGAHERPGAGERPDACRTCGHAPDRLAPGLLVATGHLLPVSDVHRLARTSKLVRMVVNAKGQILDMGRAVRLATPAQRQAIVTRYATCYVEGCPIPADMAEVDHVTGWADGGTTDLDHLAPACGWHNRDKAVHPERYLPRRNDDGTWTLLYLGRRARHRGSRSGQARRGRRGGSPDRLRR